MKKLLLYSVLAIAFILPTISFSQTPTWKWAKAGVNWGADEGYDVATDPAGNAYLTGSLNTEVFLSKYSSTGTLLWNKTSVGTSTEIGYSVATDLSANIYLTGWFNSPTVAFGTYTLTNTSSGGSAFLVKYDSSGNVIWARNSGGSSGAQGFDVAIDKNGNAFVTGSFGTTALTFGTYTLTNTGPGNGIFLVRYDANGNVSWAKSAGPGNADLGLGVTADGLGNAYITGVFNGSVTFGGYTLTNSGGAGSSEIYLAKYDSIGNVSWANNTIGTSTDYAYGITCDASDNLYLTGYFSSPTFAIGTYTLNNGTGNSSVFLAKFNSSGTALWAKGANGSGTTHTNTGYSVSADQYKHVYVSGGFTSPSMMFWGSNTLTFPANGVDPMFVLECDSNGTILCASALQSGGDDKNGIATDNFSNAYIGGDYWCNSFIVGNDTLIGSGSEAVFIAKYSCFDNANVINTVSKKENLIIYPNPTSDQFFIDANTTDKLTVDLYDINGRHVFSANAIDKSNINVATLNEGIYTMTIKTTDRVINKKIIIIR